MGIFFVNFFQLFFGIIPFFSPFFFLILLFSFNRRVWSCADDGTICITDAATFSKVWFFRYAKFIFFYFHFENTRFSLSDLFSLLFSPHGNKMVKYLLLVHHPHPHLVSSSLSALLEDDEDDVGAFPGVPFRSGRRGSRDSVGRREVASMMLLRSSSGEREKEKEKGREAFPGVRLHTENEGIEEVGIGDSAYSVWSLSPEAGEAAIWRSFFFFSFLSFSLFHFCTFGNCLTLPLFFSIFSTTNRSQESLIHLEQNPNCAVQVAERVWIGGYGHLFIFDDCGHLVCFFSFLFFSFSLFLSLIFFNS